MSPESTFASLLERRLRRVPGAPFITWYDDRSGERVELSGTTYANWVAKTANLLVDEYLLDPGDTVRIDLPNHWLAPVFLGASWQVGVAVTLDPGLPCDLVVTGPEVTADPDLQPVLATALLPFAVRFPEGPPAGTDDYALLWPGQPDALLASPCLDASATAWRAATGDRNQAELIRLAGEADWHGERLLTDLAVLAHPADTLLAALVRDGSLVLVHDASPTSWTSRSSEERATDVRRQDEDSQPRAE